MSDCQPMPTCSTCRFWLEEEGGFGECRRLPPQLNVRTEMARVLNARDRLRQEYEGDDDVSSPYESDLGDLTVPTGIWPPTCDIDWCGEHQPAAGTRRPDL